MPNRKISELPKVKIEDAVNFDLVGSTPAGSARITMSGLIDNIKKELGYPARVLEKCPACGQWGAVMCECPKCGHPIDPKG